MIEGNIYGLLNPFAALFAGVVASLHCVGMCGPIACTFIGGKSGKKIRTVDLLVYQFARLVAYSVLGALAGLFGAQFVTWTGGFPSLLMPLALIMFFLAVVFGFEDLAKNIPALRAVSHKAMRHCFSLQGKTRCLAMGFATPLLPCGPLYLAFWVACMSGSYGQGMVMLFCFGLGTVPALFASQLGWNLLLKQAGPAKLAQLRKGLAAFAVVVLFARVMIDLDFASVSSMDGLCFWKEQG
ncbi:sulfite exporter TauE/SafE family protein [Puniceicoccaceae bacterium K14]|nr:sulfite exporter TauE/SafE family protein [Puniceicoccaceae bacterium K14]